MSTPPTTGYTKYTPLSYSAFSAISPLNSTTTATPQLALGGLASGIDTTTIVSQLMSIERLPVQKLQLHVSQEQARASALQAVNAQLQTLQSAEQALTSPGLWAPAQSVSTSDSTKMTATLLGGAGPGGYQVDVTKMASSAQRTFNYTPPAADDTLTIGGQPITIAAGSTIDAAVSTINSTPGAPVFAAAVTNSGGVRQLILSSRQTGAANGFTATDSNGSIVEDGTKAIAGQDAAFTVNNGAALSSSSNIVTNAIPGVQLTLSATTAVSGPVTVNVTAPTANQGSIQSAVQNFVTTYNQTLDFINAKLTEKPVGNASNATDAAKGVLYGDMGLTDLLGSLRQSFSGAYAPGNPAQYQTLAQIGISTGAPVGNGSLNQDAILGKLTFDTTAFTTALMNDPNSLQNVLGGRISGNGFVQNFDSLLAPTITPGGIMDSRISGEQSLVAQLNGQIADMNVRLQTKQDMLKKTFTNMETLMSKSQSQGQWLAGQIASLPTGASTTGR